MIHSHTKKKRYNKLCGSLRSFAHRLSLLPAQDPFRSRMEGQVLSKLYDMGVLNSTAKMSDVENKLTVAAFCRRRLAVVMCMSKMAETVSAVRVLPLSPSQTCSLTCVWCWLCRRSSSSSRDMSVWGLTRLQIPRTSLLGACARRSHFAFMSLIAHCRHMEDYVTWVDTSKLKRTIMRYNDEVSDALCSRSVA